MGGSHGSVGRPFSHALTVVNGIPVSFSNSRNDNPALSRISLIEPNRKSSFRGIVQQVYHKRVRISTFSLASLCDSIR